MRTVSTESQLRADRRAFSSLGAKATKQVQLTPTDSSICLNSAVLGAAKSSESITLTSLSTNLARRAFRLANCRIFLGMVCRKSSRVRVLAKATPPPLRMTVRAAPYGRYRAFLLVELAGGAFHHATALGASRALTGVRVEHHEGLLEQGWTHFPAEEASSGMCPLGSDWL